MGRASNKILFSPALGARERESHPSTAVNGDNLYPTHTLSLWAHSLSVTFPRDRVDNRAFRRSCTPRRPCGCRTFAYDAACPRTVPGRLGIRFEPPERAGICTCHRIESYTRCNESRSCQTNRASRSRCICSASTWAALSADSICTCPQQTCMRGTRLRSICRIRRCTPCM